MLKTSPSMQGVLVPSLIKELGSHMPHGQTPPKNIKQKQHCNKSNKDLKEKPLGNGNLYPYRDQHMMTHRSTPHPPVFSCGPRAQNRLTFKNCNPIIIIIIIIKRKNEICDKCKRTEIQASVPVSIVSSELDLGSLASAYCQWLLLCTGSELSS